MYKRKRIVLVMVLTSFVCYCSVNESKNISQNKGLPPDIYVTRLSERILQLKVRGPLGTNIVMVATQKGLVVLDTYTAPIIFEQVSDIVQKEFGRSDYAYVINSHDHVDHAGGAGFFKDIIMVGHEQLFKVLKKRHARRSQWQSRYRGRIQGWIRGTEEQLAGLDKNLDEAKELAADIRLLKKVDKDFKKGFPIIPENQIEIIAFTDAYILELGDITIECYTCQAGHSPSDILIYLPEEEFIFTGDAAQPYIQKNVNMKLWLKQLEEFTQSGKPVKMILDGHGAKPFTKQDLKELHYYFKETWESVEKTLEQGRSLEQIQARCAVDNLLTVKSLINTPFVDTIENFREIHKYNIELAVNKLDQQ